MSFTRQDKCTAVLSYRNKLPGLRAAFRRLRKKSENRAEIRISSNDIAAYRAKKISEISFRLLRIIRQAEMLRDRLKEDSGQSIISGNLYRTKNTAETGIYQNGRYRSGSVRAEKKNIHGRDIRKSFLGHSRAERNRPDILRNRYKSNQNGRNELYSVIELRFGRIAEAGLKIRKSLYRGTGLYHLEHRRKTCSYRPERW